MAAVAADAAGAVLDIAGAGSGEDNGVKKAGVRGVSNVGSGGMLKTGRGIELLAALTNRLLARAWCRLARVVDGVREETRRSEMPCPKNRTYARGVS